MSTIISKGVAAADGQDASSVRHRTRNACCPPEDRRYRETVRQVMLDALRPSDGVRRAFRGSGAAMASAVADAMADLSFDSLLVFSDGLSREVWNTDRLRAFVGRTAPGSLRLVVTEPDCATSPSSALSGMADLVASGRISVRVLPAPSALPRHVAVGDARHVRVEDDPATRRATCILGDRELGGKATEVFESLWSRGMPLPR